jgi:hypothetical protein
LSALQDLEPEVRTFNTAIIACNMCGQPQEALKVGSQHWQAHNMHVAKHRTARSSSAA